MAYPKKLKERAIELAEDMSAEEIANLFSKEADGKEHNYRPDPRTIRSWISQANEKQMALTPEQLNQTRRHDRRIFRESDDILKEGDVRSIYSRLYNNEIHWEQQTKLQKFCWFFSYESNQYIDAELHHQTEHFIDTVDKLGKFVGDNFYPMETYPTAPAKSELFIPSHHQWKFQWEEEIWQKYHKLEPELYRLNDSMLEAYKSYRAAVRETLFI